MAIGVDMDDILAEFVKYFTPFLNSKYDTAYTFDDWTAYEFWDIVIKDVPGYDQEQGYKDVYTFMGSEEYEMITPVKDSQEGIRRLHSMGEELFIITARSQEFHDKTEKFIDTFFNGYFSDVISTNYVSFNGAHMTKSEVCDDKGITLMIEDSIANSIDCVNEKRTVYLMDKPWNQERVPDNIIRVNDWKEIIEKLNF